MKDRIILKSSQPLENSVKKWRKLYWITLVLLVIGCFVKSFLAYALLYLMVCYILNYYVIRIKRRNLRNLEFKFKPGITYDDIFPKLQPALLSNYGSSFMVERDSDGGITISYDGLIYDLILEEDYFRIHWRMSLGKAIFSINEYKPYRKILIAMGIIGYEIQKAFEIN